MGSMSILCKDVSIRSKTLLLFCCHFIAFPEFLRKLTSKLVWGHLGLFESCIHISIVSVIIPLVIASKDSQIGS